MEYLTESMHELMHKLMDELHKCFIFLIKKNISFKIVKLHEIFEEFFIVENSYFKFLLEMH